jgi:hypothetical protein
MLSALRRRSSMLRATALPLLAALFLAGCAGAPRAHTDNLEDLWQEYNQAVANAKYPQPSRISKQLVPIAQYAPYLVWDESGQKVLMATWSQAKFYTGTPPYTTTQPVTTWLTAVPYLQRFCRPTGLTGEALRIRLAQRLGIPPTSTNDAIVQMWVDPHLFFRPCPDPEINDQECQVNLTTGLVDTSAPCPWQAALSDQVSGQFVTVSAAHLNWMCSNWTSSYMPAPGSPSYPWTALGYTYDWGSPSFYGESEFVLPAGSTVTIQSVTKNDDYCAPL